MTAPVMRRIAFVSDIHCNLPAFEAVLAKLDELGPFDTIIGGGDIVPGGAQPGECVALARSLPWQHVRGNGDEAMAHVATDGRLPLHAFPEEADPAAFFSPRSRWTVAQLSDADVEFLAGLPLAWECAGPSGQTLQCVHATPWSTHPIVWWDAAEDEKRELLARSGADALIYGHVHYPFVQEIDGKLLACAGSVGAPFDGDPRACFAIATDEGAGWRVEHVRVAYDVEAYARALEESGIPDPGPLVAEIREASLPAAVAAMRQRADEAAKE